MTIDGASITEPPLAKLNSTSPVLAFSAYIAPEYDPAVTLSAELVGRYLKKVLSKEPA